MIEDTNGINAFENSYGHKGHPFESLVVLHYIEQELSEMKNPHYQLVPLGKKWGTNFACRYDWADGDDVDSLYNPNTHRELGLIIRGAEERCGIHDHASFLLYSLDDLTEVYQRTRKLERELSQAFDQGRDPELDGEIKQWGL
jgi:hypothetical protein